MPTEASRIGVRKDKMEEKILLPVGPMASAIVWNALFMGCL
jgi:hypothetical protein